MTWRAYALSAVLVTAAVGCSRRDDPPVEDAPTEAIESPEHAWPATDYSLVDRAIPVVTELKRGPINPMYTLGEHRFRYEDFVYLMVQIAADPALTERYLEEAGAAE